MRVLQILPDLRAGGAERVAVLLANSLHRNGHPSMVVMTHGEQRDLVPLLAQDEYSSLQCVGIRRRSVLRPAGFYADRRRMLKRICQWMTEFKPDIVATHLPEDGLIAQECIRRTGMGAHVAFVQNSSFHLNHTPRDPRTLLRAHLIRANLKAAACVIAVSEATRNAIHHFVGTTLPHCIVLRNGIDLRAFREHGDRFRARQNLKLNQRAPLVLGLGRLVPQKDFATLVRASRHVLARHPETKFMIMGDGMQRQHLRDLIRQLKLDSCWSLPGVHPNPAACLAAADVFCQPSRHEGFSIAIAEAMAAGKPVVTTRFAGVEEQVADGIDGICAPVGDEHAVAGGICRLLEDPAYARLMGNAARIKARKYFGATRFFRGFQSAVVDLPIFSSEVSSKSCGLNSV